MGKHKGNSKKKGNSSGRGGGKQKPSQAPPAKEGLSLKLNASGEFLQAVQNTDCPASGLRSGSEVPTPQQPLTLETWSKVATLLEWFKLGVVADSSAHLVFSSALSSEHRAELHRLADKLGLESVSQGVGDDRHIAVYADGCAPSTSKVELSEEQQDQQRLLYLLAKKQGLAASRDEIGEMLAGKKLTPELQSIWQEEGRDQVAVAAMNRAASRGQLSELKEAIAAHPELVKRGLGDLQSMLTPLHCSAAQGYADCLQALVDAGAPLEAADSFGQTPLQSARKFERQDTEALLLRAGARDPQATSEFSKAVPDPAASEGSGSRASDEKPIKKEAQAAVSVTDSQQPKQRSAGAERSEDREEAKKPSLSSGDDAKGSGEGQEEAASGGEQKPQYQDPRGTANPSAPPTVGQAPEDAPVQQSQPEALPEKAEDKGTLEVDEEEAGRPPYTEGSQPPSSVTVTISKGPAVVGGQAVDSQEAKGQPEQIMDARTATYGEQQGPTATAVGKQVIAAEPAPKEEAPEAGPSQPPANNYSAKPKPGVSQQVTEEQTAGSSQAGRPKGLGKSPGLPQKRPATAKGSAKPSSKKEALKDSLEEVAERLPGVWESLTENVTPYYRQAVNWVSDNRVLVAGGVAAAAVAVGGLSWLRARR